jgi:hypothetical protein
MAGFRVGDDRFAFHERIILVLILDQVPGPTARFCKPKKPPTGVASYQPGSRRSGVFRPYPESRIGEAPNPESR